VAAAHGATGVGARRLLAPGAAPMAQPAAAAFACAPAAVRQRATAFAPARCGSAHPPGAAALAGARGRPRLRWAAMLGGGGILGVGPAEMMVVLGLGWMLLGPQKLFTLSRDVGRVVGDLRRAADDASTTFTDALEAESWAAEEADAEKRRPAGEDGEAGEAGEDEEEVETDVAGVLRDVADTIVAGPAAAAGLGVADRTRGLPDLEAPDPVMTRTRFLEQLNRVESPGQVADADLLLAAGGGDAEEDVEVARLEYELAKARLAARRRRELGEVDAGPGEG
jgi:Sec-independent protein translocase protein TatA